MENTTQPINTHKNMDDAENIINRVFTDIAVAPINLLDETLPYPLLLENIHSIRCYQRDMIDPLYHVLLDAYPDHLLLLELKRIEMRTLLAYQEMEWRKGLFLRYGSSYLKPLPLY